MDNKKKCDRSREKETEEKETERKIIRKRRRERIRICWTWVSQIRLPPLLCGRRHHIAHSNVVRKSTLSGSGVQTSVGKHAVGLLQLKP